MQGQVATGWLVLLEVEPHGGARHSSAGQSEDNSRVVLEDKAEALPLGDASIDRIHVFKHVVNLNPWEGALRDSTSPLPLNALNGVCDS